MKTKEKAAKHTAEEAKGPFVGVVNRLSTGYSEPTKDVLYSKVIQPTEKRGRIKWIATKESNGHFVWRGQCRDVKPDEWEESDWDWEIRKFSSSKNDALEWAVFNALREEK